VEDVWSSQPDRDGVVTLAHLLVASTPMIVLMFWLAWRGIPTLIEWRRERKYQAEWHRTFGRS
jgi:hypothetical protein